MNAERPFFSPKFPVLCHFALRPFSTVNRRTPNDIKPESHSEPRTTQCHSPCPPILHEGVLILQGAPANPCSWEGPWPLLTCAVVTGILGILGATIRRVLSAKGKWPLPGEGKGGELAHTTASTEDACPSAPSSAVGAAEPSQKPTSASVRGVRYYLARALLALCILVGSGQLVYWGLQQMRETPSSGSGTPPDEYDDVHEHQPAGTGSGMDGEEAGQPRTGSIQVRCTKTASRKSFINPQDGSEMVCIPAGTFKMGDGSEAHGVHVDAFYISKYEITNQQFKKFVDANPEWGKGKVKKELGGALYLMYWHGDSYPPDRGDHPVVFVSWFAAKAYCEWAGGRMPTEAEWERAARGTDGRTYPWGSQWDRAKCNSASYWAKKDIPDFDAWKKWVEAEGKGVDVQTMKVGSFPAGASPYGVLDMAGNVYEWTSSIYKDYPYEASDGREDSSDTASSRVLRGGSFSYLDVICRAAARYCLRPSFCNGYFGFRLCCSGEAPK